MKREQLLLDAAKTITGERQDQYVNPEDSFKGIAKRWSHYLQKEITSFDVAIMMIEFKLERECSSHKRDNLLDICGYASIADSINQQGTFTFNQSNSYFDYGIRNVICPQCKQINKVSCYMSKDILHYSCKCGKFNDSIEVIPGKGIDETFKEKYER